MVIGDAADTGDAVVAITTEVVVKETMEDTIIVMTTETMGEEITTGVIATIDVSSQSACKCFLFCLCQWLSTAGFRSV